MNISFREFVMDQSLVAPMIYEGSLHRTTNKGVVLNGEVAAELRDLLHCFEASTAPGVSGRFYRVDAYFDQDTLYVLEINTAFVDGWGIALNLARACGIDVNVWSLKQVQYFTTTHSAYLPELALCVQELNFLHARNPCGCMATLISSPQARTWNNDKVYVYGRTPSGPNILPCGGLKYDNKLNLADFGRRYWRNGGRVKIPAYYSIEDESWANVPTDIVLKFCDKDSDECRKAGRSVIFGKPSGKAPFLRRCYEQGKLVAQDRIEPTRIGEDNCQIIILAESSHLITGYVQYSPRQVINDNSVHGPLLIERPDRSLAPGGSYRVGH